DLRLARAVDLDRVHGPGGRSLPDADRTGCGDGGHCALPSARQKGSHLSAPGPCDRGRAPHRNAGANPTSTIVLRHWSRRRGQTAIVAGTNGPRAGTAQPDKGCPPSYLELVSTGRRARAAEVSRIFMRGTPIPYVTNQPSGTISITQLSSRRSAGNRDVSCAGTAPEAIGPAGRTIAAAWKLIVAGGMGSSSDSRPPRLTGTVTATCPLAAICLAFQLSAATTV